MEFRTLSTTVGMICFSLGISGCESTIEFGEAAEPKTNDRNEVNEPANIGPNNAYFTYEVITKPSKDSDLLINTDKGSGSPFSDLKETYALILYPNIPSKKTNQEEPINLSQAVAIFQKSKTTGKTDTERKYLSPFITVTETSNYVTRVSYKDVDHQIDYDTLFKSATLGVQLASGSP
ncbi:hypothetical protein JCM19240_2504 [Vibrio maritimus]|uniref:Lipoprotein n=1 Tax=Vibrio maritimus TaxID=990268 RepID=A0A090T3L9_9VIBR|nr:hypothetical protein JCM19240_2504 [Vibrio maritimus]